MPSASDIVTFIGIPLAVLGVLPILYTAINSLITIRRIQRTLHRNGLHQAITRGSLMSGIVEVSLPRFTITPLDREEDPEYWTLNPKSSTLKGGSWTLFNWNCLITGSRLYRLQYSDELQIPQAEIGFEDLVSFLLDRGAVPDVKGMHMLRLAGLWTPTGTGLLLSPDTMQSVLRVALTNDSDGVLSLALHWNDAWDRRDPNYLSPGWIRLQLPQEVEKKLQDGEEKADMNKVDAGPFPLETFPDAPSLKRPSPHFRPMSLRLRLGHLGKSVAISNAVWEHENMPLSESPDLDHLHSSPASNWAPSVALAFGLSRSLPLYNHHLDHSLISLATRDTIPCGVLVTLGLLDEREAPPWETKYDPFEFTGRNHSEFLARSRELAAESQMRPDQAAIARSKRMAAETHQTFDKMRKDMERETERRVKRQREAVGSSRLDTIAVTNAAVKYLKAKKIIEENQDTEAAVEAILVGMIKQEEPAMEVCTVLERWRAWTDRGGMTIEDLEELKNHIPAFCNAACVMGLIRDVSIRKESQVALDMRECMQHWQKVRLG
ncbi:hypothetical protein N7G274_003264 [Stereocaulon virgatum]|uniref:Uncharacterized protein n=1 Tax=Stereocaulon virgatum TaxID=373712 RepID=A0ABR4ADB7_9LECA